MPSVAINLAPTWQLPPITLTSQDQAGAATGPPIIVAPVVAPVVLANADAGAVNVALQALLQGPPGVAGPPGSADPGNQPYTATISGGVITENANGQEITTTFGGGTITAVYGAPISQTWRTIVSSGTITTSRTA